jgi:hypothetical protein
MGLVVVTLYAACAISVDVFKLKMMAAFYAAATAFLAAMALGGPAGNGQHGQHGQGRSGALPRQAS